MARGPSRSAARGTLPDQGPNPCPPHWQADSQPLRHQGSPLPLFLMTLTVLRTGQVLDRMALSWGLSDVFLMVRRGLWVFWGWPLR